MTSSARVRVGVVAGVAAGIVAVHALNVGWARRSGLPLDVFASAASGFLQHVPVVVLAIAAAALVPSRPGAASRGRAPRWILAAIAAGHLALVVLFHVFVLKAHAIVDDTDAYTLLGRAFAAGEVTVPAFDPPEAVRNRFVVPILREDGSPGYASSYGLTAGLLTLPGVLVGSPFLAWLVCSSMLVYHGARLVEELWPDADGRFVAVWLATCPMVIGMGAAVHTAVPAAVVLVILLRCVRAAPDLRAASVGVGASFGALVWTRPFEAGVVGLFGIGWLAWFGWTRGLRATLALVGGIAVGGAPFAILWATFQDAVTGSPILSPYALLAAHEGRPLFGFGDTAFGPHDLGRGLALRALELFELGAWVGAPIVVVPVVLLLEHRREGWVATLGALGLAQILAYVPAPFEAVPTVGPTYRVWTVALLALGIGRLTAGDSGVWRARIAAMTVVTLAAGGPWLALGAASIGARHAAPEHLAEQIAERDGPLVVLYDDLRGVRGTDKLFSYPVPQGDDDRVLWLPDTPAVLRALPRLGDRVVARIRWVGDPADPMPELHVVR